MNSKTIRLEPRNATDCLTVRLEPHSIGDLLQEVARAYMGGGMPTGVLKRVLDGIRENAAEVTRNDEDTAYTAGVIARLEAFIALEDKVIDETYK